MKGMRNKSGFSLLEVVVSIVIMSIAVPGTFHMIMAANEKLAESKERLQAVNQAQAVIERLRYYVSADPDNPTDAGNALADGIGYSPASYIGMEANPNIDTDPAASWVYDVTSLADSNCRQVDVTVSW